MNGNNQQKQAAPPPEFYIVSAAYLNEVVAALANAGSSLSQLAGGLLAARKPFTPATPSAACNPAETEIRRPCDPVPAESRMIPTEF